MSKSHEQIITDMAAMGAGIMTATKHVVQNHPSEEILVAVAAIGNDVLDILKKHDTKCDDINIYAVSMILRFLLETGNSHSHSNN